MLLCGCSVEKKNLVTQEEKLSPPSGQASGSANEINHVGHLSEVEVINGQKPDLFPIRRPTNVSIYVAVVHCTSIY